MGINAYDALHVVTEAIQQIHTDDKVSRATVEAKIAAIEVSSASGPIAFDDTGNRTDLPTVVELCPPDDETKPPTSVVFNTSKPIDRTQCADN
jgi:ABC-type branched-subunit amino acid transport system substrate-binding protein